MLTDLALNVAFLDGGCRTVHPQVREMLMALAKFQPVSKEEDQELRDWQNRLPQRRVAGDGEKKEKKGGKKGGKKK